MMLPLAAYGPDDVMLLGPDGAIRAGVFYARAHELAEALPDTQYVINLCDSRVAFMLGFAAALIRGQTSLLPSGQGRSDWEQLAQSYPGAPIICDRAVDVPLAFDMKPFLAMEEMVSKSATPNAPTPMIPAELIAAILFTSGSTGRPTAHAKNWAQLSRGAANLMSALAWKFPFHHAVVGSVPPQHMFGLETTVLLPWHAGIPVHTHKPLLPADIETAIGQCGRACWWMTTPVHLRPPLQSAAADYGLAGILASTMSLPATLAIAAEVKWHVPVIEIYGSTETGALAIRRTAVDEWWTPLPSVEFDSVADSEVPRIHASGPHIGMPVLLADELRFDSSGRFQWLGRATDMLKIAGKRASLSALNQRIAEIPGVEDAVYFVPDADGDAASHDDAHPPRRLAAFYVSATLSHEQVLVAIRERVDPVFVPRPLIRATRLPRNENGKLPHAALSELFSQLPKSNQTKDASTGQAERLFVVPSNHPALPGHFPGSPIVPGVVILSYVTEEIRRQLPGAVLTRLLAMRFHAPLLPDRPFAVYAELQGKRVRVEVRESGADGPLIAVGAWDCDECLSPIGLGDSIMGDL